MSGRRRAAWFCKTGLGVASWRAPDGAVFSAHVRSLLEKPLELAVR